jgi:N4-(beta-N-acetylglucosaminyl)-L-asparaginase
MSDLISRRDFLNTAGMMAAGTALGIRYPIARPQPLPPSHRWAARPVVIASGNGVRCVEKAYDLIMNGADTLDAAVEGVKILELDPDEMGVGYGGLPNEEGVVQLEASCMHGPTKQAGAVALLEGIKTPSEVAKLVFQYTEHTMLAGDGAKRFALSFGFKEEELLTEQSRRRWLRWRQNRGEDDNWRDVEEDDPLAPPPAGTVNCNAVGASGEISSVTTSSGLAWKIPGRISDCPIIGAGQYTDPEVGAAGSTGYGEANIKVCGAFLCVEYMRRGLSPTDAGLEALRRTIAMAPSHLVDDQGHPHFYLNFYLVNKAGEYAGVSHYPSRFAVQDGQGARSLDSAYLFEYYERAQRGCELGEAWHCAVLGRLYENGVGVPQDSTRAAVLFKKACDLGFTPACR